MPQPQMTLLDSAGSTLGVALEQLVDDEGAHLVRAELGERALEGAADGRANGVDDDCFRHLSSPVATDGTSRNATRAASAARRRAGSSRRSASGSRRCGRPARRTPRAGRGATGRGSAAPSASRASSGSAASSGVSNRPGAIVQTRMPSRARSRAAGSVRPDDAALRRRVGGLADLAVEGGDRGGHHERAALAVGVGLVRGHRRGRQAQDVEGADQVHAHDGLERLRAGAGPSLAHGPLGPADARAATTKRRPPSPSAAAHRGLRPAASSVTSASNAGRPSSPASTSRALRRCRSTIGHARAARGELACGGLAEARGARRRRVRRCRSAPSARQRTGPLLDRRDATASPKRPPSSVRKSCEPRCPPARSSASTALAA